MYEYIFLAIFYRDSDCLEGVLVGFGVNNGRRILDGAFIVLLSYVNRDLVRGRFDE